MLRPVVQPKKVRTVSDKPRKRRQKKDRDENRPKRPMPAYFLWLNSTREEIKKDNPGISLPDLSKKAGEMWRELTDKKVSWCTVGLRVVWLSI